jgi:arylsulfatase
VAHDPIVAEVTKVADNREPQFVFPEQVEAAKKKIEARGRKPNLLIFLTDDVGWGDFGCYGGEWPSARRRRTSTASPVRASS